MRWVLPLSLLLLGSGLLAQEQDDKDQEKTPRRVRVLIQPGGDLDKEALLELIPELDEDGLLELVPHLDLLDEDVTLHYERDGGVQLRLRADGQGFEARPDGPGCDGCCLHQEEGAGHRFRFGMTGDGHPQMGTIVEDDVELLLEGHGPHTRSLAVPHGEHGLPRRNVERRVIIEGHPGAHDFGSGGQDYGFWTTDGNDPHHGFALEQDFTHAPMRHNPHQDVLKFHNGDVLSGTLVGASETHLSFKTPHGTLEVSRDEVLSLDFAQAQMEHPPLHGMQIVPGQEGGLTWTVPMQEQALEWAVPVDPALPAAPKGWLGIGVAVEDENGAVTVSISGLVEDGPAASAGLQDGDQLLSIAGKAITSYPDIISALSERAPGDTVAVDVQRGEEQLSIQVTLGERPQD